MEPQQQQQQYQYQQYQQQQPSIEQQTTYDPTQYQQQQSYDYASYQQQQQQQQDYANYYYQQQQQQQYQQDYSTSVVVDPNAIHPPGVDQNYYYPHGVLPSHSGFNHGFLPAGAPQAGQPVRGRGASGRGRGRGGGRGKSQTARSAPGAAEPSRMAWCEVCRTNCTTFEVLEQHKNGKRHQKNLKVQAELMGLGRQPIASNPETVPPQNADMSNGDNPPNDTIAPEFVSTENKTDNPEGSVPLPSQESVFAGRGGFKRKMRGRGGRGAKWTRAADGSRRPVDPKKPKQVFPLICELCNVKCESPAVFQTHLAGKKHIAIMKRFEGHKEVLGEGIQALYPSISHLIPSGSFITQANQPQQPQDAQALASVMLSQQNLQDPQAAQAALTQLLHQHGIHDAQTLIAQLVPYLLTQVQAPGTLPAQAAGYETPAQNLAGQEGAPNLTGSENVNVAVENQTEQQAPTATVDSEVAPNTNDKPENIAPEGESQS